MCCFLKKYVKYDLFDVFLVKEEGNKSRYSIWIYSLKLWYKKFKMFEKEYFLNYFGMIYMDFFGLVDDVWMLVKIFKLYICIFMLYF